jgi:3-dehydroquinate dehydratase/shikimate dehydrogenase
MLNVLGAKIGAPWTYAALERGMEAYPGQATITDLVDAYRYRDINRATRLIGVTGFNTRERATAAALNAAFAHLNLPVRCLPMGVGSVRLFQKVSEAVKLAGAVIDADHRSAILEMATGLSSSAARTKSADVLLYKDNRWYAHDTQLASLAAALEAAAPARAGADKPLQGRIVLIAGTGALARGLGLELKERGCLLIIAGHDRDTAHRLAQELQCRFIQFEALYSTNHDVLIVSGDEKDSAIHPGYLRSGMTVMDARPEMENSQLLRQAQQRGCAVVEPRALWLEQVALQARLLSGKEIDKQLLADAAPWFQEEE